MVRIVVQYRPGVARRRMATEKEMFVCPRPYCTRILLSQPQLEDHIEAEHSKPTSSNKYFELQFSFDQEQGGQHQEITKLGEEVDEDEFEFEPTYLEPEGVVMDQVEKKTEEARTVVSGDKLSALIDLMKVKRATKEKAEKEMRWKKKAKNRILFKIKSETFIRKSKSSFTMDYIEKRLDNLEEKTRAEFQVLIDEGRDEEIYRKIFGDLNTNREWVCIFHKNGKFQGKRRAFENHFKEEHGERIIYTCELCQKQHKKFSQFGEHLREAHYKETQCDTCKLSYSSSSKLLTHLLKIHGSGGFPCDLCEKKVATKHYLKAHRLTNHSSAMFPCTTCSKYFKTKNRVEQHEKIHSRLPKVKNEKETKSRIEQHEKKIYRRLPKMKTCEACGRMVNSTKFAVHKKFHMKHESLQCKKCEKFFRSPNAVKYHVRTVHDRIREYSCQDCLFSSSSNWHLQLHMSKVHLNILDTCHICLVKVKSEYHHVVGHHKQESSWKDYLEKKKRLKDEIPSS